MKKDFIGYEQYEEICERAGIEGEGTRKILVDFLHDLGVVLHFEEPGLKETNVINPKWVTEAVYRIINSRQLADGKGVLSKDTLNQILNYKKYPSRKHDYILELMKKFEICYGINGNSILVPDLLKVEEPYFRFDYKASLKFIIEYDYLPKSIMATFIVKRNKEIKGDYKWRTGVVINDRSFSSSAVIKVDEREKQVLINVNGTQKREYFSTIRKTLLDINESFEKLDFKEMVPCCCIECENEQKPFFYDYLYLIKRKNKGKTTVDCQESIEEVLIEDLLSGIEEPDADRQDDWDVFISYSSKDFAVIEKVVSDLKRSGISYWWDDEQILPGDSISQKIEVGLAKSRFVMPCFSQNQIKSGWCRVEYTAILNKVISGKTDQIVTPLILDNLPSEKMPLLISDYKLVTYSDKSSYKKLLRRLKEHII